MLTNHILLKFRTAVFSFNSHNFHDFAESPTIQQAKTAVSHFIQYNQSYKSLEAFTSIVNSTPGAKYQIPSTTFKIKKLLVPIFVTEYFIKCSSCKKYMATTKDKVQCYDCNRELKRGNSEYFIYMPVKPQLKKSITEHFEEIMSYRENFAQTKTVITDVQDCNQFKIAQKKHPNAIVLSLTVNTDGAKIFNGTNKSVWPIQICQNYLPPQMRYLSEHIMVVALHSGKPNMRDFFYPFLNELKEIYDAGGIIIEKNGQHFTFLPLITNCTADLPAKAAVQGMVSHNGHFACGYCMHEGDKIKKNKHSKAVIRYTRTKPHTQQCLNRTHTGILNLYENLRATTLSGIKNVSCMIAAYDFDLVNGFSVDYMHCALLGITKKLLDLWLNPANHSEPFYIPKKKQVAFSSRIVSIKPLSEINRKPRSIFDRNDFKANEFRSLLLYYLRYCLVDMLPMKYIDHFQLFSSSIYLLLQTNITLEDISSANDRLNKFANEYQDLYHEHNVTMNLHLLRHIANSVREIGPLWAQSSFTFETYNGVLIRSNHSTNHFLMDLAWKYSAKKSLQIEKNEQKICVSGVTTIRIQSAEKSILNKFGFKFEQDILTIYKFFSLRHIKFSSLKAKDVSTIDYFVELHSGEMGVVHFYFVFNEIAYAFIQLYEKIGELDHLKKVYPLSTKIIANVESFKRKLMFIKIGRLYEIVVGIPNHFEKT